MTATMLKMNFMRNAESLVYMISMAMMFHLQYIMAFLPFSTEDRKAAV